MAQRTGAMANEATRKSMRRWFISIIIKGLVGVVALNLADAILLRTKLPFLVQATLAVVILIGTIDLFMQAFAYIRFSLARHVLMNSDWQQATGSARRVYLLGVPIGTFGVMTCDGDDWLLARRMYPTSNAIKFPDELSENNLVVAVIKKRRVFSLIDGSTPVYAKKVRPRRLARALRNAVLQQ